MEELKMRIGIDLQVLQGGEFTGIANYAYLFAKHLLELQTSQRFVFFIPQGSKFAEELRKPRGEVITLPRKSLPFVTSHFSYAKIMQRARLDVLHGPANSLPWLYGGRAVVTIHDLAIYRHPEWFPKGQKFSTKYLVPHTIRRADHLIVPSHATAYDLVELFKVLPDRITIIPHGVEERFFKSSGQFANRAGQVRTTNRRPTGERPYILFVGTLEPRKNLRQLIEAYESLPQDILAKYDLVLAGAKGWGAETTLPLAGHDQSFSGTSTGRIMWLGYVPSEQSPSLYHNAAVFVYPSLSEGFGMPVLEAMAASIPVVTSQGTSMAEFAQASLLVDPHSVQEIRDAIVKLIRDSAYSSQISYLGQQIARRFTWERTALETLRVYELINQKT